MELTELQKHDESKVTVFIFHSLAFFKFVWCNLNNKIFLKCFSFHGCKFSLTQFICFCQLIFNSYISILPFWSTVRWGRRGKECWQYNTDYSLGATQTGGVPLHQVVLLQIELQYCVLYGRKHKPDVLGVWNSHERLFKKLKLNKYLDPINVIQTNNLR